MVAVPFARLLNPTLPSITKGSSCEVRCARSAVLICDLSVASAFVVVMLQANLRAARDPMGGICNCFGTPPGFALSRGGSAYEPIGKEACRVHCLSKAPM